MCLLDSCLLSFESSSFQLQVLPPLCRAFVTGCPSIWTTFCCPSQVSMISVMLLMLFLLRTVKCARDRHPQPHILFCCICSLPKILSDDPVQLSRFCLDACLCFAFAAIYWGTNDFTSDTSDNLLETVLLNQT